MKPSKYESRNCFSQNSESNYTQMYGEIDDFKMFARALTGAEFAALADTDD